MWRERLREASYKGVPFGVVDSEESHGRRVVVHEFVGKDEPTIEDLGGAPRQFSLQAFVLGDDFMDKRDALKKVLNEKGTGTLIHPWYGEIEVSQYAEYKIKHSASTGRMCTFELFFVQDDESQSPRPRVNSSSRFNKSASLSSYLSASRFDSLLDISDLSNFVKDETNDFLNSSLKVVQDALGINVFNENTDFIDLAVNGESIAKNFINSITKLNKDSSKNTLDKGKSLNTSRQLIAKDAPSYLEGTDNTPTKNSLIKNKSLINELAQQTLVIELAKEYSSDVPESRKAAQTMRYELMDSIDELLSLKTYLPLNDDLYTSFVDLRASSLAKMSELAHKAPQVKYHTPKATLPSLNIVYAISAGTALNDDFLVRNKVKHPGFIPQEELEVLEFDNSQTKNNWRGWK